MARVPGTPLPHPAAELVAEANDLTPPVTLEEARALLDDLHAKLDSDTDLRLSISWRLEKPGSSK